MRSSTSLMNWICVATFAPLYFLLLSVHAEQPHHVRLSAWVKEIFVAVGSVLNRFL